MEAVIFSMKILGSGLILISGTLFGFLYSAQIQNQYIELEVWKRNFTMIYGDISYGGTTFQEVIIHLKEQNEGNVRLFFQEVEEEMKGYKSQRFYYIWEKALAHYFKTSFLSDGDRTELNRIGDCLGNVDQKQQLSMIKLYLNKLELSIEELGKEKDGKIKLYRMLGTLGSIFVIILLF